MNVLHKFNVRQTITVYEKTVARSINIDVFFRIVNFHDVSTISNTAQLVASTHDNVLDILGQVLEFHF
jgi:hypothetical protein